MYIFVDARLYGLDIHGSYCLFVCQYRFLESIVESLITNRFYSLVMFCVVFTLRALPYLSYYNTYVV